MRLIDAEELNKNLTCDVCGKPLNGHMKTNYANIRASILAQPTIDPETLPIVQELRERLAKVTTERDVLKSNPPVEIKCDAFELTMQLTQATAERDAAVKLCGKLIALVS